MISYVASSIIACALSSLSYILTKYFLNHGYFDEGTKLVTIMFHTNIINLTLFFTYFFYKKFTNNPLFDFKDKFFNKTAIWQILLLALPVYSAIVKSDLAGCKNIQISSIDIASMLKPFLACFLSIFILKEKFQFKYVILFSIALFGFFVANIKINPNQQHFFEYSDIFYLLYYVFISALGNVTRRYYCKKREGMEAQCAEYLVYFFYGTIILLFTRTLSLNILFNQYTFIISVITFSHHYFLIHGVQKSNSIASLELLGFSKVIFSLIFSFLILNNIPTYQKIIGSIIILISIILFKLSIEKREKNDKIQNKN